MRLIEKRKLARCLRKYYKNIWLHTMVHSNVEYYTLTSTKPDRSIQFEFNFLHFFKNNYFG